MSYVDRTLSCVECSQPFTFSAEDQEYHAQRGYANEPKRCPDCRASRRDTRNSSGFGSGGGYGASERQMYPAVCAQCGKDTEVPFQPRGDRPVYCRDCYNKTGGASSRERR
ncbi:MAG: zinc-binding protein [Dehalococcoidia bacterium]|nr:zinc-binding protein [Dehalococcoidia bacterium]